MPVIHFLWCKRMKSTWFGVHRHLVALLQVVFVIDPDDTVFVIHARPLTERERKRYRRRVR